jgi:hypothetical protein
VKLAGTPRKLLLRGGLGLLAAIVVLQLLPFGRDHSNPAVARDAPWPDGRSRALAQTACYDCHSNRTNWPFYSYVAPMSWLVTRDVHNGRDKLNFSEWTQDGGGGEDGRGHEAHEPVEDGSMPPTNYTLLHPDARLSDAERAALADALRTMEGGGRGRNGDGDDNGNRGPGGGGEGGG